jgi:hypothetical protein
MTTIQDADLQTSPRWSAGGAFLEALTNRDRSDIAAALSGDVRLRAMLPPGPRSWQGADEVADVFLSWFGGAEEVELLDAAIGEVAGRLHLSWRLRVRSAPFDPGGGWYVIEQQAYADAGTTIDALDLLCSGFRPDRSSERS